MSRLWCRLTHGLWRHHDGPGNVWCYRCGRAAGDERRPVDRRAVRARVRPLRRALDRSAGDEAMTAHRFELHRDQDISGVSGVGVVAEGVAFTDGTVALRWL